MLGNVKGIVASVVSVFMFHNAVSWIACVGYVVTVAGSVAYGESKRRDAAAAAAYTSIEDVT